MERSHANTGVNNGEVEPHLIQSLMQKFRQGTGSPIEGVLGRMYPPLGTWDKPLPSLLPRKAMPARSEGDIRRRFEALDGFAASYRLQIIKQRWLELCGVSVRVDNRMVQSRTHCRRPGWRRGHKSSSRRDS